MNFQTDHDTPADGTFYRIICTTDFSFGIFDGEKFSPAPDTPKDYQDVDTAIIEARKCCVMAAADPKLFGAKRIMVNRVVRQGGMLILNRTVCAMKFDQSGAEPEIIMNE